MSNRLPGMVFDRYWPSRHPGGTDYAQGRSLRVRRLYWLMALLGPLAPAILALTKPTTRTGGAMAVGIILFAALAIFLRAMRTPNPPAGYYEIDEQGEPLEYLGRTPPLELRKARGVTWEAFEESVRSRGPAR
jgi:hypothetical protein